MLLASTFRALQLIELDPIEALAAIAPSTGAAAFMGAMLVAVDAMDVVPHSQPLLELFVLVAMGALLFFAGLFVFSRSSISELWSMRRLLRSNRAVSEPEPAVGTSRQPAPAAASGARRNAPRECARMPVADQRRVTASTNASSRRRTRGAAHAPSRRGSPRSSAASRRRA